MRALPLFVGLLLLANAAAYFGTRGTAPRNPESLEPHSAGLPVEMVTPSSSSGGGRGKIALTPPVVDFGEHFNDEEVEAVFTMANVGTGPLRILRIEPGCGCARIAAPTEPLLPGESRTVVTRIRLAGTNGEYDRVAQVFSDDPQRTQSGVRIMGRSRYRVTVDPGVVSFDPRGPGEPCSARVVVQRVDGEPMGEVEVISESRDFSVREIDAKESSRTFELSAENIQHPFKSAVLFKIGGTERFVAVNGEPYMEVEPLPRRLSFGLASRGETRGVTLSGKGDDWELVGADCQGRGISALVEGKTVTVRINESAMPGVLAEEVKVRVRGASPSIVTIPVTAFVKE